MTFTGAFAVRIFMTPTVLLIIACGRTVYLIVESEEGNNISKEYGNIFKVLLMILTVFVLVQMATAFVFCIYTGEPITKNIQFVNTINDVNIFN